MMNIEDVREYCLSLPNTTEDMPFGDDILCLRVDGRIFALLWLGWPDTSRSSATPTLPQHCASNTAP